MITIDLENLQGWNDLPNGTYSITVGAKAEGYTRIIQSQAVSVVKESPQEEYFLTFSSISPFTISAEQSWDGTLEYSTDKTTWTEWDGSQIVSNSNNELYIRGIGNTLIATSFILNGNTISCTGNIENLLDYQTVENGQHPTMADSCYAGMFGDCTSLTTVPELPATTLTDSCYSYMFYGCTSLTTAPELPATTLANNCYECMFGDCTSLTTVPELPATTLAESCYSYMFQGCTSLTTVPELPATTLAGSCYEGMFSGCTSLYVSDTQTTEAQHEWRIPSSVVITGATYLQSGMFYDCLGTRASNDLAGQVGQQYVYYTQNEPV